MIMVKIAKERTPKEIATATVEGKKKKVRP
jgi:hypothetical protein